MKRTGLAAIFALALTLAACDREPQAGPDAMGKGEASALMDAEAMLEERPTEEGADAGAEEATPAGEDPAPDADGND